MKLLILSIALIATIFSIYKNKSNTTNMNSNKRLNNASSNNTLKTSIYQSTDNSDNQSSYNFEVLDNKFNYEPIESNNVLINPLMGWAPEALYTDYSQPHSLVYANLYWKDIEKVKGIYDFEGIEKIFNFKHWKNKNIKFIIRIVLDYPNEDNEMTIPDWLYNEIDKDGTWYNIPYGTGFSPNYENKTLIMYHEKLIKALGEKYNNSSEIAFIELGSIGHWGEWHTYDEKDLVIHFPNKTTCDTYVSHYLNYTPNKILMMRRPFSIAKENKFGLFNDMLGDKASTKEFISWINNGYYNELINSYEPAMKDFWKYAPSGGEFSGGNSGLKHLSDSNINNTIDQIKNTHITFIGPNCPADKGNKYKSNFDKVLNTLGYRFVLKNISYNKILKPDDYLKLDITLENKGVAPFYFNWPINIIILNEASNIVQENILNEDLLSWLPGTINLSAQIKIDSLLEKGSYTVAIGIIEPSTNKASIKFANEGEPIPNYFKIAEITIE